MKDREMAMPIQKKHLIEVLGSAGCSEYFVGWSDLDALTGPEFSSDRDYATKYDLTFHRDEVLTDYERLCEMGFDASIETLGYVSRPSISAPRAMSPLFQHVAAICAADRARVLELRGQVPALQSALGERVAR
jgi:hypothetical protein